MKNKETKLTKNMINKMVSFVNESEKPIDESLLKPWLKTFSGGAKDLRISNPALYDALSSVLKFSSKDKNQIKGATIKNPNTLNNVITNVDDLLFALRQGNKGMTDEVFGLFNQGLLKSPKTPLNLLDDIAKDVVKSDSFINKFAKMSDDEIRNTLKNSTPPYSPNAIDELIKAAKEEPKFLGAKTKPGTGTPPPGTPPKTSKVVEALKKLPKNIKDGVINLLRAKKGWKVIVKWALLSGVVSLPVLWWFMKDSGEELPSDFPNTEPQDFPPCVRDLIKNKGGQVLTDNTGTYIFVKDNEFTAGVKFYSNGRVADVKTKKMGTYKCKGEQVALQEQSSEIDVDTLTSYVNTAIDDLDGYVGLDNLNSLENIVRSLLGKTFEGKNALSEFNYLYKENEDEDFYQTISNVGVKTLDPKAVLVKRNILGLLSGKISSTTQTSTQKIGDTINITWDEKTNNRNTNTNTNTNTRTKVKYEDKSDFPFPRGTRNKKIREVQIALGFPQKYQTGNFGPITYRGIVSFIQNPESYKYGLTGGWSAYIEELKTKGLTKDLYDIIMRFGKKIEVSADGQTTSGTTQPQGQTTGGETSPVGTQTTGSDVTTNTTSPDRTPATTDETPSQLFNRFVKEGTIKGRLGGKRIVYKGPDLTDGDKEKLVSQLNSMGFRISDDKLEYRKGDKIIFKRGLEQE